MRITWGIIHGTVFAAWLVAALLLAVSTAMLGGEEAQLQRQRGADRKAQLDLLHRRERLSAVVEQESSPALVERAVKRLELDIEPARMALYQAGGRE
ncbi:MAG: hypothetical protein PF961_06260 [Planctomycetota bacterium]|jgi:hypothetical protein|nr:hypothetical protein [Planctomycetota bacterium]